jgi:hypothetical protein
MNFGDIRDFGVVTGAASPTSAPVGTATMQGRTPGAASRCCQTMSLGGSDRRPWSKTWGFNAVSSAAAC